jgi:hypothetical protein
MSIPKGKDSPIVCPIEGRAFDSFSIDLKTDSNNLFILPSISQKGTSSSSLSFSSRQYPYFLRPHSYVHTQGLLGVLGTNVIKEVCHAKEGHKSTHKHAMERASNEVSQGRQMLISRVRKEGFAMLTDHPRY